MLKKILPNVYKIVWVCLLLAACGQTKSNVPANPQSVFLVIRNSGSTNSPGFTLTIFNDGSGSLIYEKCKIAPSRPQCQKQNKTFPLQAFQLNMIRQYLAQISSIRNIPNHYCTKSASFGSITKLLYNGQESGDISCINANDPQTYQYLKKEVETFISQARQ